MSPSRLKKFAHYKWFGLAGMLVVVGGIFATVASVQQNQDVRSRASGGQTSFREITLVQKKVISYVNIGRYASSSYGAYPRYSYLTKPSAVFPQPVTEGNLIIVAVSNLFGSVSVSDNVGNVYKRATMMPENGKGSGQIAIFYAENTKPGMTSITPRVGTSDGVSAYTVAVYEYAGAAKTNALDKVSSAYGRDSVIRTGTTATTSQSHELVFTAGAYTSERQVTLTPDANYRLLDTQTDIMSAPGMIITQDKYVTGQNQFSSNIPLKNFFCKQSYSGQGNCATAGSVVTFRAEAVTGSYEQPTPTPVKDYSGEMTYSEIALRQKKVVPYVNPGLAATEWYKAHPQSYNVSRNPNVAFPNPVAEGSLIVVAVANLSTAITFTDNLGNTYRKVTEVIPQTTTKGQLALFYAENVRGGTVNIIPRADSFQSATAYTISAYEYSGVAKEGALDKVSTGYSRNPIITTGTTQATSQAKELVFTAGTYTADSRPSLTPDTNYRFLDFFNWQTEPVIGLLNLITQDKIVSAQGQYSSNINIKNFSCTNSYNSQGFCATAGIIATFRAEGKKPAYEPTQAYASPTTPYESPTQAYASPTQPYSVSPTQSYGYGNTILKVNVLINGVGQKSGEYGNIQPKHPEREVTIDIFNAGTELIKTVTGTITYDSATGLFRGAVDLGSAIPDGPYIVKLKTEQTLRKSVAGIQQLAPGKTVALADVKLQTGDINDDNKIDILDYNIFTGCYSDLEPAKNCAAGNEVKADLNDDGRVNQFDYNLFIRELSSISGQ